MKAIVLSVILFTGVLISDSYANVCDRNIGVVRNLTTQLNKNCNAISADDLLTIKKIFINGSDAVTTLSFNDFDGLSNLTSLTLSQSQITSIDSDAFDALVGLEFISIYANEDLTSLPEELFSKTTKLSNIYISGKNGLTTLPEGIFSGLVNLKYIEITNNSNFTTLPEGLLNGLSSLKFLYLEKNSITDFPPLFFREPTALQTIYLWGNPVSNLDKDLFSTLGELQSVALSFMGLENLPTELFLGNPKLNTIWLNDNDFTTLSVDMFDHLSSLSKLFLMNVSLEQEVKAELKHHFPHAVKF